MATSEHFMATDIEWDPTGRYVGTSVHEMTNGFNIWSFNGKLLYRILKDHFFQGIKRANQEEVIFTHTRGKQFLIMRNVPCLRSAGSVEEEYEATGGEVLLDNEDNDGWLATMEIRKITNMKRKKTCPSMETLEISKKNTIQSIASHFGGEEEEDIPDMAEYEEPDNLIETDPEPDDDNIPRIRTYDVSITYEKYYQTPRVWLTGYDEEEIAKNLDKYSKKYEAEDQDVSLLFSEQDREKRKMLKEEWERWVLEWKRLHKEEKSDRQWLRDGEASDEEEEYEAKEVEVEEYLDVSKEVQFDFGQPRLSLSNYC